MARILLVLSFIISGCATRRVQFYPCVDGRHQITEQARTELIIRYLIEPDPGKWRITILPEEEWWRRLRRLYGGRIDRWAGGSAYTLTDGQHTFLNAEWVRSHTDDELAIVLAHEWGHILCKQCNDDEAGASNAGLHILRMSVRQ